MQQLGAVAREVVQLGRWARAHIPMQLLGGGLAHFLPTAVSAPYISTCAGDGRSRERFGIEVRRGDGVERG